jgi:hypothetical protein
MTNLICFPHYTAGGLLCDILSNTYSPIDENGGIQSIAHSIGKIGDTDTVLTDFDPAKFMSTLAKKTLDNDAWVGTHCWPGSLPVEQFNKIIVISTSTYRSKIYRWLRAYNHYFLNSRKLLNLTGMERIDKLRETAKNYLVPFNPVLTAPNIFNIEFADIVENTAEFSFVNNNVDTGKHLHRWQQINNFLYDPNLWNNELVKIFYQAEHETLLKRYYIYD